MTSKELVLATLEFRNESGRAPRDLWTLPWAELHEKAALDDIRARYVWDLTGPPVVFREPSPVERGCDWMPGEYVDAWGCRFLNINRGVIGQVKEPQVTDDDWSDADRVTVPENWLSFDRDAVARFTAGCDQFVTCGACPRPFEQLQFIRGTANLYMDLLLQPAGFRAFLDKMQDFYCRLLTAWAETDVDALNFMDDWGSQRALLIDPKLWREVFKPLYRDYVEIAHSHGKKIFMHSDGYILDIIPDLVELGVDAVNSQIFCMGPENLAPFRGKITFWGEIDRQHLLPHGTRADIRRAVRSVYDALWCNGGCIAQCEFGPGANPENVDEVFAAWNDLTE